MARLPASGDPVLRRDDEDLHTIAVFARDVVSVSSARDWLGHFLSGHHVSAGLSADAALVLSELATNALRHGMGDIVALGSVDDDQIRLSVTDSGEELPDLLPASPDRIGGLGLHLVGRVADDWGVAPFPGGKTVWATLDRRRE
jgi:anti-sigma regulatory factor (Ser/Thr protein kinase)